MANLENNPKKWKWTRVNSGNSYQYVRTGEDNRIIDDDFDFSTGKFKIYNLPNESSFSSFGSLNQTKFSPRTGKYLIDDVDVVYNPKEKKRDYSYTANSAYHPEDVAKVIEFPFLAFGKGLSYTLGEDNAQKVGIGLSYLMPSRYIGWARSGYMPHDYRNPGIENGRLEERGLNLLSDLVLAPAAGKMVKGTGEVAGEMLSNTKPYRSWQISNAINNGVNSGIRNLSNRTYTEHAGNYRLYSPFGERIGNLVTGSPFEGDVGRRISFIKSTNGGKGVTEDLYNVATLDALNWGLNGLESGHNLLLPELTTHVTTKFPGRLLDGVKLLTGTTNKPYPFQILNLTEHEISGFKPLLTTTLPLTSLKFFERPSKLTEAERLGIPKGERVKNRKHYTGIGRNYRKSFFGEEIIPKDVLYVEPISSGKKFGETDHAFENRKYATQQYLKELNNRKSSMFSNKGVEDIKLYISQLNEEINPNFVNDNNLLSFYIRDFRHYLNDLGYKAGDLSDIEIAKLLTDLYNTLSKSLTGKLKGKVVFHSGPNFFDLFDFSHTGETTGNMGYLGPGNYFSIKPSIYGGIGNYTTLNMFGMYRYPRRLPFLINNILSTPTSGELEHTSIVPEYLSPPRNVHTDLVAKQLYIDTLIKPMIEKTKSRDMAILDDISVSPHSVYTNGIQTEFMVPRNTGIKSLFPHPSLFIKDSNGNITLNRNWEDIRVNYKQGGKMNILLFLKNGSGIHIKKKNRGKFTDYCGGKVTDECIRKAKASGNPTLVKRATFAANARKWKHEKGGQIKKYQLAGTITMEDRLNKWRKEIDREILTNNNYSIPSDNTQVVVNPATRSVLPKIKRKLRPSRRATALFVQGLNLSPELQKEKDYQDSLRTQAILNEENFDNGVRALSSLGALTLPSTYVGFAMGNYNKPGTGNTAADLGIDLLSPIVASKTLKAGKFLWNNGKVFLKEFPATKGNFYRVVKNDAILDANNTGIIRSKKFKGAPYFSTDEPIIYYDNRSIIEGTPETPVEWTNAHGRIIDEGIPTILPVEFFENPKPSDLFPIKEGIARLEVIPWKGDNYLVPTTGFSYWKKHPIIGWRLHLFKKQGGKL